MINARDVQLHLSEVKGPVMDRLQREHFLSEMTGQVYLSQFEAVFALIHAESLTIERQLSAA